VLVNKGESTTHWLASEGVQIGEQPAVSEAISHFRGFTSGTAKASFLLWVTQHPEYAYVWHLEDDVYFSGPWSVLVDSSRWADADFVGHITYVLHSPAERAWNCEYRSGSCLAGHEHFQKVWWPVLRLSHRFAVTMADELENHGAHGHHEILAGTMCYGHPECAIRQFENNELGTYTLVSIKYSIDVPSASSLEHGPANQLSHPLKCTEDPNKGLSSIRVAGAMASCMETAGCPDSGRRTLATDAERME
jgi:hypothetical protein